MAATTPTSGRDGPRLRDGRERVRPGLYEHDLCASGIRGGRVPLGCEPYGHDGAEGNASAQIIQGNAGANVINGGLGNDMLYGLGGADSFLFDTALNASTNVDAVA